jgi:hypothetical protein
VTKEKTGYTGLSPHERYARTQATISVAHSLVYRTLRETKFNLTAEVRRLRVSMPYLRYETVYRHFASFRAKQSVEQPDLSVAEDPPNDTEDKDETGIEDKDQNHQPDSTCEDNNDCSSSSKKQAVSHRNDNTATTRKPGRPKIEAVMLKEDVTKRIQIATNEAALKFAEEKIKRARKRLPNNFLRNCIEETCSKYDLETSSVSQNTVRKRYYQHSLNGSRVVF